VIEQIWVGTFKGNDGKEQILVFEAYCNTAKGEMMTVVPAMTVKEDRLNELLPEWKKTAEKLGVKLEVSYFKRCLDVDVSELTSLGVF
jgi:hypothetical protein